MLLSLCFPIISLNKALKKALKGSLVPSLSVSFRNALNKAREPLKALNKDEGSGFLPIVCSVSLGNALQMLGSP